MSTFDAFGRTREPTRIPTRVRAVGLGLTATLICSGCMPEPVRTVDVWLEAYAADDRARLLEHTVEADRSLLERGLVALETASTSTFALAVPPRPLEHEILDVVDKSDGREVIEVMLTLPNPLASTAERVGQNLPLPETRPLRRRFLSVLESGQWRVKLDLSAVLQRTELASNALDAIANGDWPRASELLDPADLPPPPDDGNGLADEDRLLEDLRDRLARAKLRVTRPNGQEP